MSTSSATAHPTATATVRDSHETAQGTLSRRYDNPLVLLGSVSRPRGRYTVLARMLHLEAIERTPA